MISNFSTLYVLDFFFFWKTPFTKNENWIEISAEKCENTKIYIDVQFPMIFWIIKIDSHTSYSLRSTSFFFIFYYWLVMLYLNTLLIC